MTSSAVLVDACHVHSSSPLVVADQVQGVGYSESEAETNAADHELETDVAALELETDAVALELETDAIVLNLETETHMSGNIKAGEVFG
jgi:beta-galactosidase beta subunit